MLAGPPASNAEPTTLDLGTVVDLEVDGLDANGQAVGNASVAWASSDTTIATVDGSGVVKGASEGETTIFATAGSISDTGLITVVGPAPGTLRILPGKTLYGMGDTTTRTCRSAGGGRLALAGSGRAVELPRL